MLTLEDGAQQLDAVAAYFDFLGSTLDRLPPSQADEAGETIDELLEIAE
jgi:hypothetical protein